MKRFHVHVSVKVSQSIGFYSKLFGAEEKGAACCYAKSDKHWIQDPQGIAWETFHTLGNIPVYGENAQRAVPDEGACCIPAAVKEGKAACCA